MGRVRRCVYVCMTEINRHRELQRYRKLQRERDIKLHADIKRERQIEAERGRERQGLRGRERERLHHVDFRSQAVPHTTFHTQTQTKQQQAPLKTSERTE